MTETIIVDNINDENIRLDVFIIKNIKNLSRTFIQKMISNGYVDVNNKKEKAGYKTKLNDKIDIIYPELETVSIEPENIPLEILHEDKYLLIINKPAGIVVHPSNGHYSGTLVNALLYHCKNLSGINGVMRPGIVHRLDKDTSGLMVIAKDDFTHKKLQDKWQNREINRKYIALVHGTFAQTKFMINAPIGRDQNDRQKMKVTDKNSRTAITHFTLIEKYINHSLISAKLDTGRTHQVRVHLAFIKHPVVGDNIYGHGKDNNIISRQALHSALLEFVHPKTNESLEFASQLPGDIIDAIKKINEIES